TAAMSSGAGRCRGIVNEPDVIEPNGEAARGFHCKGSSHQQWCYLFARKARERYRHCHPGSHAGRLQRRREIRALALPYAATFGEPRTALAEKDGLWGCLTNGVRQPQSLACRREKVDSAAADPHLPLASARPLNRHSLRVELGCDRSSRGRL